MRINHPLFDPAEQAALLVAGALPPDEVASLEARLAAGDVFLASEIESYDAVLRALNGNVAEVMPDPLIKQSLLDRISRPGPETRVGPDRSGRGPSSPAEVFIRRAQFSDWEEYGVPGIQRCVLFRDFKRNLQTSLIRIAPGVEAPPHPHPQAEECYVVEGDFMTSGTTLFAGDYMRSPAGSSHGATPHRERLCSPGYLRSRARLIDLGVGGLAGPGPGGENETIYPTQRTLPVTMLRGSPLPDGPLRAPRRTRTLAVITADGS